MYVSDLKRLLDCVPDNAPVLLGNTDVTVESISYGTFDGLARLEITKGFQIVSNTFVEGLFNDLNAAHRQVASLRK